MSADNPTLVLVPGSFASRVIYETLICTLESRGYEVVFVSLPSVVERCLAIEERPSPATMEDDAHHIQSIIRRIADSGQEVLLIAHSYGAIPATESCRGVTKAARTMQGKAGGVMGLLYLTGWVPMLGESMKDILTATSRTRISPNNLTMEGPGYIGVSPELSLNLAFPELNHIETVYWLSKLSLQSLNSVGGELSFEGWKYVPVCYVYCNADELNPPYYQRQIINAIEEETRKRVKVYECNSGHFPNISNLDFVVDVVTRAAQINASEDMDA
ncbi:hypothetical protein BP5796_13161 [Coleophoma crateriformis]|uniref:AB hydrolase-1 domain-containing protein n=1 Tax=Coleophoma crateriformis TaxID=565419 RepID=A0A3D8Q4A8_9HELO|nr:hypothetical protein BP5796_13161 [Coleophoma crateriformis]